MGLLRAFVLAAILAAVPLAAGARSHGSGERHRYGSGERHRHGSSHRRERAYRSISTWPRARERDYIPVEPLPLSVRCSHPLRDWRGRFIRCSAARAAFERDNPCPSTGAPSGPCPGYVVDHIIPLKRGGADLPENMQWQTVEDARAKDRVE